MLPKFIVLSVVIFAIGYLLSDMLLRRRGQRLRGSRLETKIFMWIPLFFVALAFAYGNIWAQTGILLFVLWQLSREVTGTGKRITADVALFAIWVGIGLLGLFSIVNYGPEVFLAVWFMSVLSDVVAFFAGNYAGKHKLPAKLNNQKSWEGVAGQFVGAALAFALLLPLDLGIPAYFILTVGLGSAFGDLANSHAKRQLGIKEWSNRIPGHGGYLDRFASLAGASLFTMIPL